jgi:hypothetical protein
MENIILCQPIKSNKCEHGKQKRYCIDCDGNGLCFHKKRKERCKLCGGSAICIHNKDKSVCKECKGGSICEHGKYKRYCVECDGNGLCLHKKMKGKCRDCQGSSFCEHGKIKSRCKDCGGNQICEHNKIKYCCLDCKGASLCEHNKQKPFCKDCNGSSFCEHGKRKSRCKDCGGNQICEHKINKFSCKICNPKFFCEHNKRKSRCVQCNGSGICKHNKCKYRCFECFGSGLCKNCKIVRPLKKYNNHCLRCFIYLFPDKPVIRNYKTKESSVAQFVTENFPNFTWNIDKKVEDGCSKRRPDLMCDLGYQVLIVEVDENQHDTYDCSCENKRIMQISQDLGHRPLIFIRFNPDDYLDSSGNNISSCWTTTAKTGIIKIKNNKTDEWSKRLAALQSQIEYWSNEENKTEKTIEIVQLFYDGFQ